MKKGIHPELVDCTFKCACGNTFVAKSNKETCSMEVCNECHSFFTGKQGSQTKGTNIDKFKNKYNYNVSK